MKSSSPLPLYALEWTELVKKKKLLFITTWERVDVSVNLLINVYAFFLASDILGIELSGIIDHEDPDELLRAICVGAYHAYCADNYIKPEYSDDKIVQKVNGLDGQAKLDLISHINAVRIFGKTAVEHAEEAEAEAKGKKKKS